MSSELRIFVYGTLKRGFSNHERYCKGLLRAEPACLTGRLYKLTAQIPVMIIPDRQVLARGSADIAADVQTQEKQEASLRREKTTLEDITGMPGDNWRKVCGELFRFGDPGSRLPSIDFLEDFQPGQPSTYNRVLVPVTLPDGSETTAWVYVAGFDVRDLEEYEGETWV